MVMPFTMIHGGDMNERIKELAEQADIVFGFDKNNDPEVICAVMDIEKFAELIVRECADIASINQYQPYSAGHYVKKHFGVK